MVLSVKPAYAYLDPGAGSMFVQALVACFALIAAFFDKIKMQIKSIFAKLFHKQDTKND